MRRHGNGAGSRMGRRNGQDGGATIVLKREEVAGHGHHGGAWKVAYYQRP